MLRICLHSGLVGLKNQKSAYVICERTLSIDSPSSLDNVCERWAPEAKQFCPNIPIILVGKRKQSGETEDVSFMVKVGNFGIILLLCLILYHTRMLKSVYFKSSMFSKKIYKFSCKIPTLSLIPAQI